MTPPGAPASAFPAIKTLPRNRALPAACALLISALQPLSPSAFSSAAPDPAPMLALYDRARADNSAHEFLEKLCDDNGGRMPGTAGRSGATAQIMRELRALGYEPQLDAFPMPGWLRGGNDRVEMLAPVARVLRAAAAAYTNPCKRFEAGVVALGKGREEDFAALPTSCAGEVGLVDADSGPTGQVARRAAARGLRGVLFTDRINGGQLLARTGSYKGEPLPVPAFSLTQEEGLWIGRLLARGVPVRVALQADSRGQPGTGNNIVLRIPGESAETIVVGAHADSWALGQGAIDNGLGVAQLYAIAKNLRGMRLRRTVELVWFDGEEFGLWGSRHRAAITRAAPIAAMINLDMVGVPASVNALGDDTSLPVLRAWVAALGERAPARGAASVNWLGGDHTPFQLAGVRAITFDGPIPPEVVRYYHDFGDTIDKVSPALVSDSAAPIAALVWWLAQDDTLGVARRPDAATRALFANFGDDSRGDALAVMMAELLPPAALPATR